MKESADTFFLRKLANAAQARLFGRSLGAFVRGDGGEPDATLEVDGLGSLAVGLSTAGADTNKQVFLTPLLGQLGRFVDQLVKDGRQCEGAYLLIVKVQEGGRLSAALTSEDTFGDDALERCLQRVLKRTSVDSALLNQKAFLRVAFRPGAD